MNIHDLQVPMDTIKLMKLLINETCSPVNIWERVLVGYVGKYVIYITRLIFPHQVVIASLQCSSQVSKTDIQVLIDPITYILIKKFVKQSNGVSVQLRACSDSFHLATMEEKMDAMVVNASDAIFSSDLSWSTHYNAISTKAYQTLGLIRWTFKINCTEAKKQQCLALVRSQLLYCSQLWRPQLIRDISICDPILKNQS